MRAKKGVSANFGASGNKYGAKATIIDEIRFASKLESELYVLLRNKWRQGEIRYFLRQVPIHLTPEVKTVIDFLVFPKHGPERWLDAKGRETEAFRIRRKLAKHLFSIDIELVGQKDLKKISFEPEIWPR